MSVSEFTQKAISSSLKELMKSKPFDKITVSDITEACGLNRQTFYYHYQDKYELLQWIYKEEIVTPFMTDITLDNWYEHLYKMFVVMKNDEAFYRNAFTKSHDEFHRFLFQQVTDVFIDATKKLQLRLQKHIDVDDELFISQFFAYGITGVIMDWAQNGMKETPRQLTDKIQNLVKDCHNVSIDHYFGTL